MIYRMRVSHLLSLIVSVILLTGLGACDSKEEYGRDFDLKERDIQVTIGETGEVEFIYGSGNYRVESQDESIATGVVTELDQGENGCRLVVTSFSAGKTTLTVSNGFDDIDVEVSVVYPYMSFGCKGFGFVTNTEIGYDTSEVLVEMEKDFPFAWNCLFMLVKDKPGTFFYFASKEDAAKHRSYQAKGTYTFEKIDEKPYLIINLEERTFRFAIHAEAEGKERLFTFFMPEWLKSKSDVVESIPGDRPMVTFTEDITDELREKFGEVIYSAERNFSADILDDGYYRLPVEE